MSEDSASPAADTLGTPGFIYECQKTLDKIQGVLHNFGDPSNPVPRPIHQKSRFSVARLQSLKAKDLKWPMARSKTLELIGRLERHKATCTIALACTGIAGVHSVLRETELSNKCLAEIRAKQETILKLQLSQEQGVLEPLIFSFTQPHEDSRLNRRAERHLSQICNPYVTNTVLHDIDPQKSLWVFLRTKKILRESFVLVIAGKPGPKASSICARTTRWYWNVALRPA